MFKKVIKYLFSDDFILSTYLNKKKKTILKQNVKTTTTPTTEVKTKRTTIENSTVLQVLGNYNHFGLNESKRRISKFSRINYNCIET